MKQKQFIICPQCKAVELAEIDHSTIPFSTYIHICSKCNFIIMESDWNPLRAISIKNPFAWWIVNKHKNIENRSNLKNFRGLVLIHASLNFDYDWVLKVDIEKITNAFRSMPVFINKKDSFGNGYDFGGIIGYATITDCVQESNSPWFIGPNGFIISEPHKLPFTPCKGSLGFFKPKIINK